MRESPVLSSVIAVSSFLSPRSARVYPDIRDKLSSNRGKARQPASGVKPAVSSIRLNLAKAKDCLPRIINSALFSLFRFLSLYFSHTTCLTALDGSRQPPQGR